MTAVEYMIEELKLIGQLEIPKGSNAVTSIINEAKAMEKQQGYSEKEVFKLLGNLIDNFNPPFDDLKDWFEQNKK